MPEDKKWEQERINQIFDVENFKRIGKENDIPFQMLCFLQNANTQISLAFTRARQNDLPESITREFHTLFEKNRELQDTIRAFDQANKQKKKADL